MSPSHTPAGWYDDGSGQQRWWDGEAWGPFAPSVAGAEGTGEGAPVSEFSPADEHTTTQDELPAFPPQPFGELAQPERKQSHGKKIGAAIAGLAIIVGGFAAVKAGSPNKAEPTAEAPVAPGEQNPTAELSPVERNRQVLDSYVVSEYVPGEQIEAHERELMTRQGSTPQMIEDRQSYLAEVRSQAKAGPGERPIEYLDKLGNNFGFYANLLQANKDSAELKTIKKAGVKDIIMNVWFTYNDTESETIDVSDDIIVRTISKFVSTLPGDAIVTGSRITGSRLSTNGGDPSNNGTWVTFGVQYSSGETTEFDIQVSDMIPDVTEHANDPYIPFDSSIVDNSAPVQVAFDYRPEGVVSP